MTNRIDRSLEDRFVCVCRNQTIAEIDRAFYMCRADLGVQECAPDTGCIDKNRFALCESAFGNGSRLSCILGCKKAGGCRQ